MTVSDSSEVLLEMDATSLCDFYKEHPKYQECDVTTVKADAIVCSTQTNLRAPPYGLCAKVFQRGGPDLKQANWERKRLEAGKSFVSKGYGLRTAKYVIFTAGPDPDAPYNYEERLEILKKNYCSALDIVREREDIRTVAFPCLGTGGGGLHTVDASRVAVRTIRNFLVVEENRNSLDVIILCMYSEEQWDDYLPELLKAFPYGLDLQGYDLEALEDVQPKHLGLPPCSTLTNNLGLKYDVSATKTIRKHFHRIVDQCVQRLKYNVIVKTRFCNCAILTQTGNCEHQLTILNSETISMVEIQVTRFNDHLENIRSDICQELYLCIIEYFKINLENITSLEYYLRCHQSSWGQADGLWKYSRIAALSEERQTCDKHELSQDYHQFLRRDMLQHWNIMAQDMSVGDCSPQKYPISKVPVEHSLSSRSGATGTLHIPVQHKRPPSLSYQNSIEEGSLGPSASCSPSSESSCVWKEIQMKQTSSPNISQTKEKEKVRKKQKLGERLKRNNRALSGQTGKCLVVEDHEKKTHSQCSSDKTQVIRTDTLCRELENPDLLKFAKHIGCHQTRVGLYLKLTDADIQIEISKARSDAILQGYYIIQKWIKMQGKEASVGNLLEAYHECDIDIYPIKEEFRIE